MTEQNSGTFEDFRELYEPWIMWIVRDNANVVVWLTDHSMIGVLKTNYPGFFVKILHGHMADFPDILSTLLRNEGID